MKPLSQIQAREEQSTSEFRPSRHKTAIKATPKAANGTPGQLFYLHTDNCQANLLKPLRAQTTEAASSAQLSLNPNQLPTNE